MDQGTLGPVAVEVPIEVPIDDGRRFVERFAADGNPVQAAFWVKTAEEELWFLYVVTALYECAGPAAAYRAVHTSFQKLGKVALSSSEVKLISPNNSIARDVLALMARYPGRYFSGAATLGSMPVDQVFIYPTSAFTFTQPIPMTSEEIGREMIRLMNRGPGILKWSQVTLKDGTAFRGVPSSVQSVSVGNQSTIVVRFLVDEATREVRLDEIASISSDNALAS